MGDRSNIAWCDATWNPITGCSHVSAGCEFCYAEALSLRRGWSQRPWTAPNAAENVVLHPERLEQPLRWQKPRRIFVNSMSDLFHEQVSDEYIAAVFGVMAASPRHTFQVLTKRPERMRRWFGQVEKWADRTAAVFGDDTADWRRWHCLVAAAVNQIGNGKLAGATSTLTLWPLPNVWLGVSIEEDRWCGRADLLRQTPAAVRFISAEPLLAPLLSLNLAGIDWLIVGGESGAGSINRKLVQREWERDADGHGLRHVWVPKPWALREAHRLRGRARTAGTAFFFKQWGGVTPRSAGHLLDGVEYHEFPEATS